MQQVREQHVVSAAVDAETQAELRRRADAADRTVSAEVRRALRRYLGDDLTQPHEHEEDA